MIKTVEFMSGKDTEHSVKIKYRDFHISISKYRDNIIVTEDYEMKGETLFETIDGSGEGILECFRTIDLIHEKRNEMLASISTADLMRELTRRNNGD